MTGRLLWLSPWMRPLARVYCEALRDLGWDVVLVTSDQHPESGPARDYEWVLDPRPKAPSTWGPFAGALRRARAYASDVVLTELVRDPRWIALAGTAPRLELVHDDRPHGVEDEFPRWERGLFGRWNARAQGTVAFSEYVAARVGGVAVPLTSDLDQAVVPAPVSAAARRDFVAVGRLNPYKNLDVTLRAWERHVAGPGWRGDDLVLIGDGDLSPIGVPHVRWERGRYSYADVIGPLSAAKGSVVHYRQASQSGVQVLAMQLGVCPIVSPVGALPEYQPAGERPIPVGDVEGLARAFDRLADPEAAADRGRAAAERYHEKYAPSVAAARLDEVLRGAVAARLGGAALRAR